MKFIGPASNIELDTATRFKYGIECFSKGKTGIHPVTLWYNTEEERDKSMEKVRAEGSGS